MTLSSLKFKLHTYLETPTWAYVVLDDCKRRGIPMSEYHRELLDILQRIEAKPTDVIGEFLWAWRPFRWAKHA